MKSTDKTELLISALQDLLSAEEQIVEALPTVIESVKSAELKKMLNGHLSETEEQHERLKEILKALDGDKGSDTCEAMKGILEEGTELIKNRKTGVALDLALAGAAAKVEHYEMSAYSSAIALAQALGHDDHVETLQETFSEEITAAMKLESFIRKKLDVEDASPFKEYAESGTNGAVDDQSEGVSRKRKTSEEFMTQEGSEERKENKEMAKTRQEEHETQRRERDDQGRFVSQDDDRSHRSRHQDDDDNRGQWQSRGQNRDERGRFTDDDNSHRGRQQWNEDRDEGRGYGRSYAGNRGNRDDYGNSMQGGYSGAQYGGKYGRQGQDQGEYERSYARNQQYRDSQGRYMNDDDYRSGSQRSRMNEGYGREPWDDNDRSYSTSPYSGQDHDRRWSNDQENRGNRGSQENRRDQGGQESRGYQGNQGGHESRGYQGSRGNQGDQEIGEYQGSQGSRGNQGDRESRERHEYRSGSRGNWNDDERMYGHNYPGQRGNQDDYDRQSSGQRRHQRYGQSSGSGVYEPDQNYRGSNYPREGEGRYPSEDYDLQGRFRGQYDDFDEDQRGDNPIRGRRGAFRK